MDIGPGPALGGACLDSLGSATDLGCPCGLDIGLRLTIQAGQEPV